MKYGKINHVGIVVKDINEAKERYSKLLGIKTWYESVYDDKLDLYYHGEKRNCDVKLYFGGKGSTTIELIETSGDPNIYNRFYEKHGESVHHLMYMTKNLDQTIEEMAKEGYKVFQNASFSSGGAKVRYAYIGKTEDEMMFEFIECSLTKNIKKGDIPCELKIGSLTGSYRKVK